MIIGSQNSTGVTCKGIRTVSLTGSLHSYIHNSQNVAATQEVISRWMDQKKLWFIGTMGCEPLFENQKFFYLRWQGWIKHAAFHSKNKFWWSMAQSRKHKPACSDSFKCPHHKVIYKYVRWQASSVALFKRYIKMRHYPMYITIVN